MADQGEDKKSEHINIRVLSADKGEVYFKIRKTTPLKKLMDSYCEKQGIASNSIRFMFEDKRLNPSQTAEQKMMTLSRLTTSNKAAIMILSNKNDIPVRNAVMDYNYWLGRTIRVSLQDGRIFQGQFVAVDRRRNVLLRYCEALECSKASLRKN